MTDKQIATGLGLFSLALGAVELAAPNWLGEQIGAGKHPNVMRAMGAREGVAGAWLLSQRATTAGLWNRVVGDTIDLAALAACWRGTDNRARLAGAMGAVAGCTMLDFMAARRTQQHDA
jgi:hypothetical protein